jgi:hypothetical protein
VSLTTNPGCSVPNPLAREEFVFLNPPIVYRRILRRLNPLFLIRRVESPSRVTRRHEVLIGDPAFSFVGVSPARPSPEHLKHRVIDVRQHLGILGQGYSIIYPTRSLTPWM